tara:strand:+ start:830 stop:1861 length:1032 start_codon:yes stop_codon:yes gene_type:complete
MPDYGTKSRSGVGARSTYRGGSGYTTSSQAKKSRSKASERRLKAAKQAKARAEKALADQKRADAAKAISSLGMTGAAQAAAQSPKATQVGYSPSQAKDRTPVNKSAFEKIKDDFLMDIGVKNKDADYYRRLGDRSDAAKKEQERLKEKRERDRRRARSDTTIPPRTKEVVDDFTDRRPPDLPPPPVVTPPVLPPPIRPTFPDPYGGLAAFGYSPALMQYESQQGAGQVPYYMAAARNQFNPNLSPAFQYAAQNYDILGGMQRTMPRPIEMMSARERAQIMNMGSNFNVPNYNSPYYQPSPQSQFDFFSNMVGRGGGKGMGRPMPQTMARAMRGGLGSFFGGFT